jgi:hypothetical protein
MRNAIFKNNINAEQNSLFNAVNRNELGTNTSSGRDFSWEYEAFRDLKIVC